MKWKASWIWVHQERETVNICALARKEVNLEKGVHSARLAITADTRYRLFVNNTWVNDGPLRSYPWKYSYDEIDITSFLRHGENVLAVVVDHWGRGSFQSNVFRPGLLAQLEIRYPGKTVTVISDRSWKMIRNPAHDMCSPRASHHMGFEEHLDARQIPVDWAGPGFNDRDWPDAEEICSAMNGPWKALTTREIPLLEYEPVRPSRLISTRYVQPPQLVLTVDVTHHLWPEETKPGSREYHCAMVTDIISKTPQVATLYRPSTREELGLVKINGQVLDYYNLSGGHTELTREITLKKGSNPVMVIWDGSHVINDFQMILDLKISAVFRNPWGAGTAALTGGFKPEDPDWEKIKRADRFEQLEPFKEYFAEAKTSTIRPVDVHALMCFSRTLPGTPKLTDPEYMFFDHPQPTVLPPGGDDLEIVLDFGREYNMVVGFEIDAPENTIVDGYVFEKYWEHRPQHTWRHRACFRYVTRKGRQAYLSNRSFGGRYLVLTFRNRTGEIRLHKAYGLFKHYPVGRRGTFFSEDHQLNAIWDTCRNTLECCMEDTFIDCPTYEQACWVGDGRNEALACQSLFGEPRFLRRCITLPSLSLARSDLTESQVPSSWENIIPVWSYLWIKTIWEYYWFTGDIQTLGQLFPSVARMLNNCRTKYMEAETGLFAIEAWNFFDWAGMDTAHRCVTHNNIFLVEAFRDAGAMARKLGKHAEGRRWTQNARQLTDRINRWLWSEQRGAYIDSIHNDGRPSSVISQPVNTLALLYGIAPPPRQQKILPIALGQQTKDVVPFGSPFALFYLLEYLAARKQYGLLVDMVRDKWGTMLDGETTTFWESFPGGTLGGKYPTRSYCHAWSAGPAYLLSRYILGVQFLEPGGKKIRIQPQFTQLKTLRATVPMMTGDLGIEWNVRNKTVNLRLSVPDEVESFFSLPEDITFSKMIINGKLISCRFDKAIKLPKERDVEILIVANKIK